MAEHHDLDCSKVRLGAGAVMVERSDEPGFVSSKVIAGGNCMNYRGFFAGASYERPNVEAVQARRTNLWPLRA